MPGALADDADDEHHADERTASARGERARSSRIDAEPRRYASVTDAERVASDSAPAAASSAKKSVPMVKIRPGTRTPFQPGA